MSVPIFAINAATMIIRAVLLARQRPELSPEEIAVHVANATDAANAAADDMLSVAATQEAKYSEPDPSTGGTPK